MIAIMRVTPYKLVASCWPFLLPSDTHSCRSFKYSPPRAPSREAQNLVIVHLTVGQTDEIDYDLDHVGQIR